MAAEFCREVGGKRLILTHFSQRYRGEGGRRGRGRRGWGKLLGEAQEVVIGTGIRVQTISRRLLSQPKRLENFIVP